jgi:dipeptidyl aminopeptidase/acylaminoacyl peptidase
MGEKKLLVALLTICWCFAAGAQEQKTDATALEKSGRRAVTVADVIEMTRTGDRSYLDDFMRQGDVAEFSPDGSRFAFVTQKGNLSNNTVEFSLFVFETATALTSPHAERIATLASSSNREAITRPKWMQDNDTIVFLGEGPGENPQLYRVKCSTRKLEKLTNSATPVVYFSLSDSGNEYVYVTEIPPEPVISRAMRQRGFAVTTKRWEDLYSDKPAPYDTRRLIYFKNSRMQEAKRLSGVFDLADGEVTDLVKVSPDGHHALIRAYRIGAPALWNEYRIPITGQISKSCATGDAFGCPSQYLLLNVGDGTLKPLFDAPLTEAGEARELFAWTRQNSLLLVNALLPLDPGDKAEAKGTAANVYDAEVFPSTGEIVRISERSKPLPVFALSSDMTSSRFVATPIAAAYGSPFEFRKRNSKWSISELSWGQLDPSLPLHVILQEGINSPPVLVAEDPKTKQVATLLDLNPDFRNLKLGRVETVRWQTLEGKWGEGQLYYPPDYAAGRKYPLVIQTHGTSRDRFWIDGPFSTAFAAQPLAAKGFMVLQMALADPYNKELVPEVESIVGTDKEAPYFMQFLDAAIDYLDRRGLIDRQHIGLTGFSRTAYYTLYALTHSHNPIQAAVAADGVNYGYVDCVYYIVRWDSASCEKMNGGTRPYGSGLEQWQANTPTFNLNKINAAVLLQSITGPLGEWEILSGMQWLGKPVEMLVIPEGEHVLVKPWERMTSQQGVVDWYSFWILGEEDASPAKAQQYARWRSLRAHRSAPVSAASN